MTPPRARTIEIPAPIALATILFAAACAIALVTLLSLHLALLDNLTRACAYDSVVARLDLTEWVPVCTAPYDAPPN